MDLRFGENNLVTQNQQVKKIAQTGLISQEFMKER